MILKKYLPGLLLLLPLANCQYPVDNANLPDNQKIIVINAELTPNYGKVKVTYTLRSVSSNGAYSYPDPPVATAYVLDGDGNRTDFTPDGTENFTFKGVVGKSYKLYVEADGKHYESAMETMPACPEIEQIDALYSREENRSSKDLLYDGFDIYTTLNDTAGVANYYQWDWIHYYRLTSCGETIQNRRKVKLPCNPVDCWGIEYNNSIVVQSDALRDGMPLAQKVTRIPFAKPPNKYYLKVTQRAITPAVYEYYKSIQIQTQQVGSQFDIPPQSKFNSNINNVDDPLEPVLGVFNVFDLRKQVIYVDMTQEVNGVLARVIPDNVPFSIDPFASAPCTETLYRTKTRPEGWTD